MTKKKTKRPPVLFIKLPDPSLKVRLEKAAVILERSVAYVVRQAAERELERLAKLHPELGQQT